MERDLAVSVRHRERGAAIFLALFALAAISYASLRLIRHASAYSQLLRTYRDGIEHHNALRATISPFVSQTRRCELQRLAGRSIAGAALHPQDWYVCTLGYPAFLSNNQIAIPALNLDYNALFLSATQCTGARTATSRTSFDTPHAAHTCALPGRLEDVLIITDNIAIETASMTRTNSSQPVTIATPGSLVVSTSLALPGDTLIVAGGDISIPLLTLQHSTASRVTIVSAHGDIAVGRLEGALSLTALGRRSISVPPSLPSNSPLLPPSRRASIAGFIGR
jgi:hypothetical protein